MLFKVGACILSHGSATNLAVKKIGHFEECAIDCEARSVRDCNERHFRAICPLLVDKMLVHSFVASVVVAAELAGDEL